MELILASNSPRRKWLLKKYGFSFKVIPSNFEELNVLTSPIETVNYFSFAKSKDVFNRIKKDNILVLGADTIVALDNEIMGKPANTEQAKEMLYKLSGRTHQVITGYSIITNNFSLTDYVSTEIEFNELSAKLIDDYVRTGSPLDKAGAYGIQDPFPLIKNINGSYNNVVGLPIEIIKDTLNKLLKNTDE